MLPGRFQHIGQDAAFAHVAGGQGQAGQGGRAAGENRKKPGHGPAQFFAHAENIVFTARRLDHDSGAQKQQGFEKAWVCKWNMAPMASPDPAAMNM